VTLSIRCAAELRLHHKPRVDLGIYSIMKDRRNSIEGSPAAGLDVAVRRDTAVGRDTGVSRMRLSSDMQSLDRSARNPVPMLVAE
jgi:hypothetical protein